MYLCFSFFHIDEWNYLWSFKCPNCMTATSSVDGRIIYFKEDTVQTNFKEFCIGSLKYDVQFCLYGIHLLHTCINVCIVQIKIGKLQTKIKVYTLCICMVFDKLVDCVQRRVVLCVLYCMAADFSFNYMFFLLFYNFD